MAELPLPMPSPVPGLGAPPPMLPPQLTPPPANLGGPVMPQGNPGNAMNSVLVVRNAVKMLEEALPSIPLGAPLHEKVLSSVKSLLDALPDESPELAGPQQTSLLSILRNNTQSAPLMALNRMQPAAAPAAPPMEAA